MSADTGSCRACGRTLPQARRAGRPRRYCSSTCRSAGRRARVRDAALLSRHGGPCTAELAGRRCPRPAEYTLFVSGAPFPFCSACYTVTAQYLLDQRIPACELVTVGLATPAQPPAPVPGRTARKNEEPAQPTRLLLVEDDEAIREALRLALTRQGYEVLDEGTGRAGLRSAYLQRPGLVLLDVMLPDIDGMEVLRRLRTVSDVPVIYLTARSDPIDVVVGLETGADDYIVKPCQARMIDARISACGRINRLRSHTRPARRVPRAGPCGAEAAGPDVPQRQRRLARWRQPIRPLAAADPPAGVPLFRSFCCAAVGTSSPW